MYDPKHVELGPDWKPYVWEKVFRGRQICWGLVAVLVAALSLFGLLYIAYQIVVLPFGLWWALRLWGMTLALAITIRHQCSTLRHSIYRPGIRGVLAQANLGGISLLVGLAYWKLLPLHDVFPAFPLIVSSPLSLLAGLIGMPVVLADLLNNIESQSFGDVRLFEQQRKGYRSPQPVAGGLLTVDSDSFHVAVVRALHHNWYDFRYAQEGTTLKYALFLAVQSGLRNQCILYGCRLIDLYEKDRCKYLVMELNESHPNK